MARMSALYAERPWLDYVSRWHITIGGQESGLKEIARRHGGLWAVVVAADEKRGIFSYVNGETRRHRSGIGQVATWDPAVAALYTEVQVVSVLLVVRDDQERCFAKQVF